MSAFWMIAAALTLAVVGALAVPLLRRRPVAALDQERSNVALFEDQLVELERDRAQGLISAEQFEQARLELSRGLLADIDTGAGAPVARRRAGVGRYAALAWVPIAAFLAYWVLGTPAATDPAMLSAQADAGVQKEQLIELTQRMTLRLQSNPQDAEAWVLLGRSLQVLGRAPEAAQAFARATALVPDSAQLQTDYADMLVAAADGEWTADARAAIARALVIDPNNPKSLWLAGTEAYARKDYAGALALWQKLAPMAEPGSEVARIIEQSIIEVRGLIAGAPEAARQGTERDAGKTPQQSTRKNVATDAAKSAVASAAQKGSSSERRPDSTAHGAVAGTVRLDGKLAAQVQPGDTVFVFARAAAGPKMPLAVRRIRAAELPYRFVLDDRGAMAPGMSISAFPEVIVGARISRSGSALPQPGDLEGYSGPIKPGANGVEVVIDVRVP